MTPRFGFLAERIRNSFPSRARKNLPKEIAVVSVGRSRSRRLNRAYRKENQPTNVLSFRYGSSYGEIVLCLPVIQSDAHKAGRSLPVQMTRMIVHAMIHLSGIHHEQSSRAARRAAALEQRILTELRITKRESRKKHVAGYLFFFRNS